MLNRWNFLKTGFYEGIKIRLAPSVTLPELVYMLCPNCSQENQAQARFCRACGTSLQLQCAECGSQLSPDATFCDACGSQAAVDESSTIATEIQANEAVEFAQRSFWEGRYIVQESLGQGATKTVYRARDTLLGRDVAFALIRTEGLDAVGKQRILREAQTMARLEDHPNVVQIHDLGEEGGELYMVLPLIRGGSVEDLLRDSPDRRLPLDQVIAVAKDACRGLSFVHSNGIVHRDLKPGNVWVTTDGTAKIGDFGLATGMDFSRITQSEVIMGTPLYMAPEQATGGNVNEQSDLYSLGWMLYQMVAGRPPFMGDDAVAIIGQHINIAPVAPTWHNPGIPKPLDVLILGLLSKAPSERPESAGHVLVSLEAIDAVSIAVPGAPGPANVLDSLAGGVFVARQGEMGTLRAALEDCLSGRGRMVTLVGEPGAGKTRTAQELGTYSELRGALVLWGRCYEEEGAPPYWPWVQAISSYVSDREPEKLRSEMGTGAPVIAEIVPEVHERLPDLEPAPQLQDPEQARFRLFNSITSFFKTASQNRPVVLILDDLHWAAGPSLMLLRFIARELSSMRLLLVGTDRDVELSRQHPLSETLAELTRQQSFQRLPLPGLSHDDVGRYIEVTAGITPPQGLVRSVHTQTEGNPLFVTEVVRLLVQEGELAPERLSARESWTISIPEGVQLVIGRRLNRLSKESTDTLAIASVIGREFGFDLLDLLIEDLSEDQLLEVLEEAVSARLIEELAHGVARYQFTHALVQGTLADELTRTRRVRLHSKIGETLEELYRDDTEAHAGELAYHFAQAQTRAASEKVVRYSVLAGQQAFKGYAYEEGIAYLQRALELLKSLPDSPERTQQELMTLMTLGPALIATRGYAAPEVERAYARAAERCAQGEETLQLFRALWGLRAVYYARAELQTSLELGEQLLQLAQRQQDVALLLEAHRSLVVQHH